MKRNDLWKQGLLFFGKLKVFHQLGLIIGLMTLFLLLQGLIGIGIIDAMHSISVKVFNSSSNELYDISSIQQDLQQFRVNYLGALSQRSMFVLSASAIERIEAKLDRLRSGREKVIDAVREKLKETKTLMDAPVSDANYRLIDKNLTYIKSYLNLVENSVRNNALSTISNSNVFSLQAKFTTLVILVASVSLSLFIGLIVVSSIVTPLGSMLRATRALAVGDLSQLIPEEGAAEMRGMAYELNQAIGSLRQLVNGIDEQSSLLFVASTELKSAASSTGQSASQVAEAMESLAKASAVQSNQITEAVNTVDYLAELVRKVTADTLNIAAASEKVADSARSGQNAANQIGVEVNAIYHSSQEVARVIDEINKTSGRIAEITSVISGIAEQTTLLSLNASIEAARAGDQGKGFEVVAQETGKLAEQSKQAAQIIAELAGQMTTRAKLAVTTVQQEVTKVRAGKDLIAETSVIFEEIFRSLHATLKQINSVAVSAQQMAERNESSISSFNSIAAISEESLASTEEVTATAEEQSASVEDVTALADNLTTIAATLKKSVSVFKTA